MSRPTLRRFPYRSPGYSARTTAGYRCSPGSSTSPGSVGREHSSCKSLPVRIGPQAGAYEPWLPLSRDYRSDATGDEQGAFSSQGRCRKNPFEHCRIGGLGQVRVEPGIQRAPFVLLLPPSGQRHDQHVPSERLLADATAGLVPIHPRHADVEENKVGPKLRDGLYTCRAIERHARVATEAPDQLRHGLGRVFVVINDHHATVDAMYAWTCFR